MSGHRLLIAVEGAGDGATDAAVDVPSIKGRALEPCADPDLVAALILHGDDVSDRYRWYRIAGGGLVTPAPTGERELRNKLTRKFKKRWSAARIEREVKERLAERPRRVTLTDAAREVVAAVGSPHLFVYVDGSSPRSTGPLRRQPATSAFATLGNVEMPGFFDPGQAIDEHVVYEICPYYRACSCLACPGDPDHRHD